MIQPSPSVLPSPLPDPTADWKKFSYPTFEFKLPPDWTVDSATNSNPLQFVNVAALLKIIIYTDSQSLTLRGFVDQQKTNAIDLRGPEIRWTETETTLADQPAIKLEGDFSGFWIAVFDPQAKRTRQIIFGMDFSNYPELAEQILSTFKFWQEFTITDEDFGVVTTLSLPPGYTFAATYGWTYLIFQNTNPDEVGESWDYSTSIFRKDCELQNWYTGGSPVEWYEKRLRGDYAPDDKNQKKKGEIVDAIEHPSGSQSYWEIIVKNIFGGLEKHYLFKNNDVVAVLKTDWDEAKASEFKLPQVINQLAQSLKITRIDSTTEPSVECQ